MSWIAGEARREATACALAFDFVSHLDRSIPGLVSQFYLVGSVARGDLGCRGSDLGFVAVVRAALRPEQARRLGGLQTQPADTPLDGIFVTEAELRAGPFRAPSGPHIRLGVFVEDGPHKRSPLDWADLASAGRSLGEPGLGVTDVWKDAGALEADAIGAACAIQGSLVSASRRHQVSSAILSASRLHFTVATGQLTTKTSGGLYGLIAFPDRWRPILDEALHVRRGLDPDAAPDAEFTNGAFDFVEAVAAEMHELAGASRAT